MSGALVLLKQGMEMWCLLNQSTTMNIVSYPCSSFGSEQKSIDKCIQGWFSTGRGWSNPGRWFYCVFVYLQMRQLSI